MSEHRTPTNLARRATSALVVLALSTLTLVAGAGVAQASPRCTRLAFLTAPQTIVAGALSGAITVEARKGGNRRCTIPGGSLIVGLSVVPSSGGFYADAAGTATTTSAKLSDVAPYRATFYYRDASPGARQVTVTHATLGSASQTETVVVGALDHFSFVAPATSDPGSPFSVSVTAQDRVGNTLTGYRGTVHFSTGDPQGVVPSDYTFSGTDAGTHTFVDGVTLKSTGSQSIQVSDGPIAASVTVTVAVSHRVSGTASGSATLSIIPGASTCASPATTDSDHICQYNLRGNYSADPYLGSGTISGRLDLDDRSYGPNATYGLNCYSNVRGIVKFINPQGTLRTKIDDVTSVVCDRPSGGTKDIHLQLLGQPGGNAGIYSNVMGGRIAWDGTWVPTSSTAFAHSDTFAGTVLTS